MTAAKNLLSLQASFQQSPNSVVYFYNGIAITRRQLFAHALYVSKQLPDSHYALNLCQNRYLFTVAYLAAIFRNQINLLPPNQSKQTIKQLLGKYPSSYCLSDSDNTYQSKHFHIEPALPTLSDASFPAFNPDTVTSISFTSGSTGEPKKITKTWREFQQAAKLATLRLALNKKPLTILSTVPPQHMYGLETSVFWPLLANISIIGDKPFFPEDIRQTAESSAQPCLLLSTPTHIKACVNANINWQNIAKVLSSTAPLTAELALLAEQRFHAPLYEIFGSTETLSYASRRPVQNSLWRPYPGIKLTSDNKRFKVSGGHLAQPVLLDDQFNIEANGLFSVIGRSSDMIKIAGKRASLSELNRIINAISGIKEAVFYRTATERLGAFVVSQLNKKTIINELKQSIDEVFLPRPLTIVRQLPRNEVGKIINQEIQQMIKQYDVA